MVERGELQMAMRRELAPGESLLWVGQPRQGLFLRSSDPLLILISIGFIAFALFWSAGVRDAGGGPFAFFGIAVAVFGLYLLVGRFFTDSWLRSRTRYAVTDRRLIIERASPMAMMSSTNLREVGELELKPTKDERGTIIFGASRKSFGFNFELP
jgi:hypothetical protein